MEALQLNEILARAQHCGDGDRPRMVHALADGLLSCAPSIVNSYLPLLLEFRHAKDAATRETVAVFLGILLSRDTHRIYANIHTLLELLDDHAGNVVQATAIALRGLTKPSFFAMMQQPSPDAFKVVELAFFSCEAAIHAFFRPNLRGLPRVALMDYLVDVAACCTSPHMPVGQHDDKLAACNVVDIAKIVPVFVGGLNASALMQSFADRLVGVGIGSLLRDCRDARASMEEADYSYVLQRLAALAAWRPTIAFACARASSVLCFLPPAHISRAVEAGRALRPSIHAAMVQLLTDAIASVVHPAAAASFSAQLAFVNSLASLPDTDSIAPNCPVHRALVLSPALASGLATQHLADLITINLLNPPHREVTRLPAVSSASLEGLLQSMTFSAQLQAQVAGGSSSVAQGIAGAGEDAVNKEKQIALARTSWTAVGALAATSSLPQESTQRLLVWQTKKSSTIKACAASSLLQSLSAITGALPVKDGKVGDSHIWKTIVSSHTAGPVSSSIDAVSLAITTFNRCWLLQGGDGQLDKAILQQLLESIVNSGLDDDDRVENLSRLLLDIPVSDWSHVITVLLGLAPDGQEGIAHGLPPDSADRLRVCVRVLENVFHLRQSFRSTVLELFLSLLGSPMVDLEVAESAHEALSGTLHEAGQDAQEQAVRIAQAALVAAGKAGGKEEHETKRQRVDSSLPSCLQATCLPSFSPWAHLAHVISSEAVTQEEMLPLARLAMSVAHAIPSVLSFLLEWLGALPEEFRSVRHPVMQVLLSAVRGIAKRHGIVAAWEHLAAEGIPTVVLPRISSFVETLCDVGVELFNESSKRKEEEGAEAGVESEGAAAATGAAAASPQHPSQAQDLTALVAAIARSKIVPVADSPSARADRLLMPLLSIMGEAELTARLPTLMACAQAGDIKYMLNRLLRTPGVTPLLPLDRLFSLVVSSADSIPLGSGPQQVRLLTEASAALFEDRGRYPEKQVQIALQRVIVDAVEQYRKASTRRPVLPILAMRCFAVAARLYPSLRSALVEQLLGLLRAVGGAAFEPIEKIAAWPVEDAVAAGPCWHGFTRFLIVTVPMSFELIPTMPCAYALLLLQAKEEAELRKRAVKWYAGYASKDSMAEELRRLLSAEQQ